MYQGLNLVLIISPSRTRRMITSMSIIHKHRSSLIAAMYSNTQTLGQDPSTSGAAAAALKLYNIYRRRKEKSLFKKMFFSEILSGNLAL